MTCANGDVEIGSIRYYPCQVLEEVRGIWDHAMVDSECDHKISGCGFSSSYSVSECVQRKHSVLVKGECVGFPVEFFVTPFHVRVVIHQDDVIHCVPDLTECDSGWSRCAYQEVVVNVLNAWRVVNRHPISGAAGGTER